MYFPLFFPFLIFLHEETSSNLSGLGIGFIKGASVVVVDVVVVGASVVVVDVVVVGASVVVVDVVGFGLVVHV